jgi:hypothetical protein
MHHSCPFTALFGGFEGVFSFINNKSAILCPVKTEVRISYRSRNKNLQKDVVLWLPV